jgi:hypothetical protein
MQYATSSAIDLFFILVSAIPSLIPSEKLIYGLNYFLAGGEGKEIIFFSPSTSEAEIERLGFKYPLLYSFIL